MKTITTEEIKTYRDSHHCSMQEAKREIEKINVFLSLTFAGDFKELKLATLDLFELIKKEN